MFLKAKIYDSWEKSSNNDLSIPQAYILDVNKFGVLLNIMEPCLNVKYLNIRWIWLKFSRCFVFATVFEI